MEKQARITAGRIRLIVRNRKTGRTVAGDGAWCQEGAAGEWMAGCGNRVVVGEGG